MIGPYQIKWTTVYDLLLLTKRKQRQRNNILFIVQLYGVFFEDFSKAQQMIPPIPILQKCIELLYKCVYITSCLSRAPKKLRCFLRTRCFPPSLLLLYYVCNEKEDKVLTLTSP